MAQWGDAKSTGRLQDWRVVEASLVKAIELDPELKTAQKDLKTLRNYLARLNRS